MQTRLLILLLLVSGGLQAQTVLTATTNNPVPGDFFFHYPCDTAGVSPGSGGVGAMWDFHHLVKTDSLMLIYIPCDSTAHCGSFPGSNLAIYNDTVITYFQSGDSAFSLTGFIAATDSLVYSNMLDEYRFPATYGSSFTDDFYAVGSQAAYSIYSYGTNTVNCDGWGTLLLPTGEFDSVLRFHTVQNTTDSFYFFGTGTTITSSIEYYTWLETGYHSTLLGMTVDSGRVIEVNYGDAVGLPLSITRTQAESPDMSIFPNPASSSINISFDVQDANLPVSITIADMTGRVVMQVVSKTYSPGHQQISCGLQSLAQGVYLVKMHQGTVSAVKKLEVL